MDMWNSTGWMDAGRFDRALKEAMATLAREDRSETLGADHPVEIVAAKFHATIAGQLYRVKGKKILIAVFVTDIRGSSEQFGRIIFADAGEDTKFSMTIWSYDEEIAHFRDWIESLDSARCTASFDVFAERLKKKLGCNLIKLSE